MLHQRYRRSRPQRPAHPLAFAVMIAVFLLVCLSLGMPWYVPVAVALGASLLNLARWEQRPRRPGRSG